jgi:hypothetical protein
VQKPAFADDTNTDIDPRWTLIKQKANEAKAVRASRLFRDHGLNAVLIKGVAAALNYPSTEFRDSIDLDLAVDPLAYDRAYELIHSPEAIGLSIDLHRGLRHLDLLDWADLYRNSVDVELSEGTIRLLRPEDHLRILCVHWLTDGGANRHRLWDIYYAINNRPVDFDWDRCLKSAGQRRQRWIECAAGMAAQSLGLDLSDTPLKGAKGRLPNWFVSTVESEWTDETLFRPLRDSMDDLPTFLRQLKKRLPPNPITATILQNGSLDAPTRIFYQLGSMVSRSGRSLISIVQGLCARFSNGAST